MPGPHLHTPRPLSAIEPDSQPDSQPDSASRREDAAVADRAGETMGRCVSEIRETEGGDAIAAELGADEREQRRLVLDPQGPTACWSPVAPWGPSSEVAAGQAPEVLGPWMVAVTVSRSKSPSSPTFAVPAGRPCSPGTPTRLVPGDGTLTDAALPLGDAWTGRLLDPQRAGREAHAAVHHRHVVPRVPPRWIPRWSRRRRRRGSARWLRPRCPRSGVVCCVQAWPGGPSVRVWRLEESLPPAAPLRRRFEMVLTAGPKHACAAAGPVTTSGDDGEPTPRSGPPRVRVITATRATDGAWSRPAAGMDPGRRRSVNARDPGVLC